MIRREMLQKNGNNRGENVILENTKALKNKSFEYPTPHPYVRGGMCNSIPLFC